MAILTSKKNVISSRSLLLITFSILISLVVLSVAEANYWEIDYAPSEVGVIKGGDDDIAGVLTALGCPYYFIDPASLISMDIASSDLKVLFVESLPTFDTANNVGDAEKVAALVRFARNGGQLFITGNADMLIKTLGPGISIYAPTRPGEEVYQSTNVALPISVGTDLKGALQSHLGLSSINIPYMTRRPEHSLLNLTSVTYSGSTVEATALYVLRWINTSNWSWSTETANFITSFIYPDATNSGMIHYVNYPLDLLYGSGEIGEKLVKYQIGNALDRAGLVAEDIFGKNTIKFVVENGEIVRETDTRYSYNVGKGNISLTPGNADSLLRINDLSDAANLIIWKMDDDMVFSIRGTTGSVKIPGWYSDGQKLSGIEVSGKNLSSASLEELAIEKEPDIDITPVSFDRILIAEEGQREIIGSEGNDYIFGNDIDNIVYTMGGDNIYYYRLGGGNDTIINTRKAGERSVLRFHMDIEAKDVNVTRKNDDMVLTLPDGGGVSIQGWYKDTPAKLTRVELFDGTCWDARDLEKLAVGAVLTPRGHTLYSDYREQEIQDDKKDAGNSSSGCNAGSATGLLIGLFSLFMMGRKQRHTHGRFLTLTLLLAIFLLFSGSAYAAQTRVFIPPTISIAADELNELDGRRGNGVTIKPGYAYIGAFTNDQFQLGHTEIWGVDSKIVDHVIALQDVYAYDEEIDGKYIRDILPVVTLPQNVDLYVGKRKLADVVFASSDDLETGTYVTRVACDIELPAELGGGLRSTYVEYEFNIISGPVDVHVLGGLIGTELEDGFEERNGHMISEQSLAAVEYSHETMRNGLTADGLARLIIRLQSEGPTTVNLRIPDIESLNLTAETLQKQPCNLEEIELQPITEQEDLYQASVVLKAPEAWPKFGTNGPLEFTVEAIQPEFGPSLEPITLTLRLHNAPVVLVHGIWASQNSWYGSSDAVANVLTAANIPIWANSYDNWRGPSEIVPLDKGHENYKLFYRDFIAPAYEMMAIRNIECARVDVVGHSMGGLMTKRFMQNDDYYKTDENYHQGAIRRLATLGTPHWGSPFPSYLEQDARYLKYDFFTRPTPYPLEGAFDFMRRRYYYQQAHLGLRTIRRILRLLDYEIESAIDDLRIASPIIQELNNAKYEVPMNVLAGDFGNQQIVEPELSGVTTWAMWPYDHQSLFCNINYRVISGQNFVAENSDAVVGISSAHWVGAGFTGLGNRSTIEGRKHTGMGATRVIADHVKRVLTGPKDDYFTIPQTPIAARYESELTRSALDVVSDDEDFSPLEILTLGANREAVRPGDSLLFTMVADGTVGNPFLVNDKLESHLMEKTGDTYTYRFEVPEDTSGMRKFIVVASGDERHAISNVFTLTVKPDTSSLSMLTFAKGQNMTCCYEGTIIRTVVLGLFSDGKEYNLSPAIMGTTYFSSDPSVATVSMDGEVAALKPGEAVITATNDGVGAIMYLTVKPVDDDTPPTPTPTTPTPSPSQPQEESESGSGGCHTATSMYFVLWALPFVFRRVNVNKRLDARK